MHTILVADDSVTIQKAVEIAFDKEPFQVVKVGSAADAIARARELRPHLVLADHLMGDKTGYDVAEALRDDPATQAIPVLILSGSSAPYDEARARTAGVVGNINKPFDCASLLDRVRNLLGVAATAPGTAVPAASPAPTTAATAGMPRPPGIPGTASSMPRPPTTGGFPGMPRPPVTGSGAPSTPASTPAAPVTPAAAPVAAAALARTPTPMPTRDPDPFGLGALSTPPTAASTPPTSIAPTSIAATPSIPGVRPSSGGTGAFANPFATSSTIGGAAASSPFGASSPAPAPITPAAMSAPPSISGGISATDDRWGAKSPDVSFDIAVDEAPPAAAAKTAPPPLPRVTQSFAEAEFLEVTDLEVAEISSPGIATAPMPAPAVATQPAPSEALPRSPTPFASLMTAAETAPPGPALELTPEPEPIPEEPIERTQVFTSAPAPERHETPAPSPAPAAATAAAATAAVVEAAAPAIAAATGAAPSREALTAEAREIVERIAWEIVPELAEVIIREEIQRLLKSR